MAALNVARGKQLFLLENSVNNAIFWGMFALKFLLAVEY